MISSFNYSIFYQREVGKYRSRGYMPLFTFRGFLLLWNASRGWCLRLFFKVFIKSGTNKLRKLPQHWRINKQLLIKSTKYSKYRMYSYSFSGSALTSTFLRWWDLKNLKNFFETEWSCSTIPDILLAMLQKDSKLSFILTSCKIKEL